MNAGLNAPYTVMRKMVPLLLLAIGSLSAPAQVRLGIMGGLHSSNVIETNSLPGWDTAVKKYLNSRSGFQLGLILEVPIGRSGFFFQPAFTYITKGRTYDRNYDSVASLLTDTIYGKGSLNLDYIEIPLNLTYKMPLSPNRRNFFFLSAGPYVSFFYGGNITQQSLTTNPEQYNSQTNPINVGKGPDTYKTADLGINGKAGFELGKIMLSAYYSRGLTSFYNAPYPGTFHHQVFGASLAIWLTSGGIEPPVKKAAPAPVRKTVPVPVKKTAPAPVKKPAPAPVRKKIVPKPVTGQDIFTEQDSCRSQGCALPLPKPQILKIDSADISYIDYIAHNVLFRSSSDQFTDSTLLSLDTLASRLSVHPEWHLTIEGYTDNSGNAAKNILLSQKRAEAIRNYLLRKGIPASRLTAIGFGQQNPVADNGTITGRAANRRVELKLSMEKQ